MSISYLTHKGKTIMFADYRECKKGPEQLELLDNVANEMKTHPEVLLLVDYSGISAGVDYMSRVKHYGNTVFKEKMKCSAVLGVTGLKKILFDGYNRATGAGNVKSFITKEEALDWLVDYK